MPGINGIEAMKEIRKTNKSVIFIVLTAFDKFNYAKEAINLGVLEYLTKPVNQSVLIQVLQRAMEIIKAERAKRSNDLMIREKLEIVIPIIESDFIYAALSGSDFKREKDNFCSLLGIKDNYGMILVLEFGDALIEGNLTNPVGISVKAQSFYPAIRESLKEELDCVVSPIMVNKIVCFLSSDSPQLGYDDRIELIEKARGLIRDLTRQHEIQFKIGIGSVASIYKLEESYKEALSAIRNSKSRVAHVKDLSIGCEYEADYPIEIENALFEKITGVI